jgi:SNF family Na+-dependent transporter
MSSKKVRNIIIALVIMIIGSWFLIRLGKSYIPSTGPLDFSSIMTSFESLFSLFMIALVVMVIILIPVWFVERKKERALAEQNKAQNSGYHDYREIKEDGN